MISELLRANIGARIEVREYVAASGKAASYQATIAGIPEHSAEELEAMYVLPQGAVDTTSLWIEAGTAQAAPLVMACFYDTVTC